MKYYSNWAEIDLGAIRNNVGIICKHTGVQVMAIVKANAYGHGAVPVARAALQGGATWLAVARVDEAVELRRAGIVAPIFLLGYVPSLRLEEAVANRVSMAFWTIEQARCVSAAAERVGETAKLHFIVDTGMSRLGAQAGEALDIMRQVCSIPHVYMEGIFTHFARADEPDSDPTNVQEDLFLMVLSALDAEGVRPKIVHAANSAASLTRSSAVFSLVRLGISLYGLFPNHKYPLPPEFRPALSWKSVLSQVKVLPPGRGVSYGHIYTTRGNERIGTIPVGYADGYRRTTGNYVLVGSKQVPVIGRVCMDYIMVRLDSVTEAKAGDEVVLIGSQGDARILAEDVGDVWGTINYEVTCAVGARVPRIFRE